MGEVTMMSPQPGTRKTRLVVAIMKGHFCQKLSPSFAPQLELEFVCCFLCWDCPWGLSDSRERHGMIGLYLLHLLSI